MSVTIANAVVTTSGSRTANIVVRSVGPLLVSSPIQYPVTLTGQVGEIAVARVSVANGGTGLQSVTNNAILYGQGTDPLGEASGNPFEILQLSANGVPVFDTIDGGEF